MDTNLLRLPQIELKLQPGSTVVLQISFHNRTGEAMLLRPTLDDWAVDFFLEELGKNAGEVNRDLVLAANESLEPAYVYLFSGSDASQKMTVSIPLEVSPGQNLKTWLRFPGIQEEAIPIDIEIVPQSQPQVVELPLSISFPVSAETNSGFSHSFDATTAGIFGLISAVIDLDKIPTRWLVAELLIVIAQKGEEYARRLRGRKLLAGLKGTVFFKNGATALSSAKLPGWISESLAIENAFLGGSPKIQYPETENQRLLHIWEGWLLSLVDTDVELFSAFSSQPGKTQGEIGKQIFVPPFSAEAVVTELGLDVDRWFGSILLGLALLSPAIDKTLQTIAATATANSLVADAKAAEGGYFLATALPGLNFLPVRWLVVELLLVLAGVGKEYARSEAGRLLSDSLNRTRFFKNGVVALASTKVPRWLQISQSGAAAFANSIGAVTGMGEMLVFWQRWLWSLLPANSDVSAPVADNSAREALSAELGMDADRWFEAIILGLAVVSPRMAAILEAIATLAPIPPTGPASSQVSEADVIGESKSIWR